MSLPGPVAKAAPGEAAALAVPADRADVASPAATTTCAAGTGPASVTDSPLPADNQTRVAL